MEKKKKPRRNYTPTADKMMRLRQQITRWSGCLVSDNPQNYDQDQNLRESLTASFFNRSRQSSAQIHLEVLA